MKNLVYFNATHYVYITAHDNGIRNVQNAEPMGLPQRAMVDKLREDRAGDDKWVFIERMPTADEFGTTDPLSYHYRKSTGQRLASFGDFETADRIKILDQTHVLKVLEFAVGIDATDALYKGLSYLACRDDQTVVISSDGPQSFFFYAVSREEHLIEKRRLADTFERNPQYTMSASKRYHGGLIFHSSDNTWSVHT